MTKVCVSVVLSFLLLLGAAAPGLAFQEEGTLRLSSFWVMSGILASFGVNSNGLASLAIDEINEAGGVPIDGKRVKIAMKVYDDACKAEQGINIARQVDANDKALVLVGPTCSNVAEPTFGILQKKLDDPSDPGLQLPIFADTAIKVGLAKISPWAFRNVGNEAVMYDYVFKHLKDKGMKTVVIGYESDFAHSAGTAKLAMKPAAEKHGIQVLEMVEWHLQDTEFSTQISKVKRLNPDVFAIAAHPFTTTGSLKEMRRQGWAPKMLVGLTSSASLETLTAGGKAVEGLIIPTTFAPITPKAKDVSERAFKKYKAQTDLHSGAAYEVIHIIRQVVERAGIKNTEATLKQDRRKFRDELTKLADFPGLIGPLTMGSDREMAKNFVLVQVQSGEWKVYDKPGQ